MDVTWKNMDKNIFWYSTLLTWLDRHPLPPIPFADYSDSDRYYNPPAEHLEVGFLLSGEYHDLKIGNKEVSLHAGEACLHNVHFGNYSYRVQNVRGWSFFLDIQGIKEFNLMKKDTPFLPQCLS